MRELGEVGIDGEGERDVGERASGVDRDLMGVRVDLADEEVGGVFVEGFDGGVTLFKRWKHEGVVVGLRAGFLGEVSPGTVPGEAADGGGVVHGLGLRAEEREDGAGDDGDVGAVDELEHAERVLDFFGLPGVAADHGDAEDADLRGLEQDHHGHLVGAAGAGAVLVDENEARGLRGRGRAQDERDGKQATLQSGCATFKDQDHPP